MLDILISYINFIFLSLKFITRKICFRPPNPKGYRIIDKTNNETEILRKIKPKIIYKNEKFPNSDYELIEIHNEDNNTNIPVYKFTPLEKKNRCIIYAHGNCGDIGTSVIESYLLSIKTQSTVLCFEYPGYGLSKDKEISEKRVYYNIRKTHFYAVNELNFKPENIILYGFSLGTGVVFDLACDKNYIVGGVILQSPFLSIIRTIYNFKKTPFFDIFNSCDKAKLLNAKTFFIHGNKDIIVPYIHGRILSELIPKKYFYDFLTINGGNHNNLFVKRENREEIFSKIIDFVDYCIPDEKIEKIDKQEKQTNYEDKDNNSSKRVYKYENSISGDHNSNEELQKIKSKDESIDYWKKRGKYNKSYENSENNTIMNNDISDDVKEKDEDTQLNIKDIKVDLKNFNNITKPKINDLSNLANCNTISYKNSLMTSFGKINIFNEKEDDIDNNIIKSKKDGELGSIKMEKSKYDSFCNNEDK